MKTLLIADMHGENPRELIEDIKEKKRIEQVVFLGDYDTPEVLRDLRRLKGRKKFIVGNHELHYIYELGICGITMKYSWEKYAKIWDESPVEKEFIEQAIIKGTENSGLILEDKLENRKKVAYCHASIVDSGSPDSDAPGYVWQRMYSEKNALMNFMKMIEKDYWALFRGHDHVSTVLSLNEKPSKIETLNGEKIKLAKNKRYIASIGSYFYGDYALFDSDTGVLEYRNTGEGHRIKGI